MIQGEYDLGRVFGAGWRALNVRISVKAWISIANKYGTDPSYLRTDT